MRTRSKIQNHDVKHLDIHLSVTEYSLLPSKSYLHINLSTLEGWNNSTFKLLTSKIKPKYIYKYLPKKSQVSKRLVLDVA